MTSASDSAVGGDVRVAPPQPAAANPFPFPVPPAVLKALGKIDIRGPSDLELHLPLRYEDETRVFPLAAAPAHTPVQLEVTVVEADVQYRPRRQLVVQVRCALHPERDDLLSLRFFNFYPSQVRQMAPGRRLRILGELRSGFWGTEMVHPQVKTVEADQPLPDALTPIYPTTAGLSQAALRRLVERVLADADLADTLPAPLVTHLHLPDFRTSVLTLHHPAPGADLLALAERTAPAWQRIKFDELLAQQLSMRQAYRQRREKNAPVLANGGALTAGLLALLPFQLTGAQLRAWKDIRADIAQAHPMQRLLQGDVGSGKTAVAALAALQAIDCGWQAAIMAPTEILAEQHFRKMADWFAELGVLSVMISGSLPARQKRAALELVASGDARLVVGTHALIQDKVQFQRLGLVIVDEQHRFGVRQRLQLRTKADAPDTHGVVPHQLMMSATPIPRTLAMSTYADLDVSVIDELPPGRTPVRTRLVADTRRAEVIARVRDACAAGRQAYWVCPLIEESEALQLQTALDTFAHLQTTFPELRTGLIHGRLPPDEKATVMAGFAANRVQLLVATTVIEVGVDVPNATLMVIEHAERFGLAQLHQLRGRVGRGTGSSACILLFSGPLSETARARLKIIYENADGFEIARQDLLLRGPGELAGSRQSGVPMLRFADLTTDLALLEAARNTAEHLLRNDPQTAQRHLARWLGSRNELLKA